MVSMDKIETIVRFHDVTKLDELDRCIFSLFGQQYRPLDVIIVTQRFSDADLDVVRLRLEFYANVGDGFGIRFYNFDQPTPADARSSLINLGMRSCNGRYMAFLDYDDTLYPEAYLTWINKLKETQSAIAFASVRSVQSNILKYYQYVESVLPQFPGDKKEDLLKGNFCPIHSFVIDRTLVPQDLMYFDYFLTQEEDYEFLLRITAVCPSDFSLIGTLLGDYYIKTDGSNSHGSEAVRDENWRQRYALVSQFIAGRRALLRNRFV